MKRILNALLVLFACSATVASAHHSFAAFDLGKTVIIDGVVKDFKFTNPHSWLEVVVTDASGNTANWAIEGLSPNQLVAKGIKRSSFKVGDKISLTINPLRSGEPGGSLVSAKLADGSVVGGGPGQ